LLLYNACLVISAEYIVLGDFNLDQSLWGGEIAKTGTTSENITSFFNAHLLLLQLPWGTVTPFDKRSEITIDLLLASPPLKHL
jgi:hypothetical protein